MPNPNALPPDARDHARRRFECVIVDPGVPAVGEFVRREILRGTIQTVPLGPDRLMVVPTGLWPRGCGRHPD